MIIALLSGLLVIAGLLVWMFLRFEAKLVGLERGLGLKIEDATAAIPGLATKMRELETKMEQTVKVASSASAKATIAEAKTRVEESLREKLARRMPVQDGAASEGWRQ